MTEQHCADPTAGSGKTLSADDLRRVMRLCSVLYPDVRHAIKIALSSMERRRIPMLLGLTLPDPWPELIEEAVRRGVGREHNDKPRGHDGHTN